MHFLALARQDPIEYMPVQNSPEVFSCCSKNRQFPLKLLITLSLEQSQQLSANLMKIQMWPALDMLYADP
jgi:hypothetical protein